MTHGGADGIAKQRVDGREVCSPEHVVVPPQSIKDILQDLHTQWNPSYFALNGHEKCAGFIIDQIAEVERDLRKWEPPTELLVQSDA